MTGRCVTLRPGQAARPEHLPGQARGCADSPSRSAQLRPPPYVYVETKMAAVMEGLVQPGTSRR